MFHTAWSQWWPRVVLLLVVLVSLGQTPLARGDASLMLTLVKGEERYILSLAEIESLGLHEVTMRHPEGPEGTFAGVWLDALLQDQGLDQSRRVRFIAKDDYTTFLSPEERADKAYLLVTRLDGEPLTNEALGPFMLVVPEDREAVLQGTESMTHWIWAIEEIRAR